MNKLTVGTIIFVALQQWPIIAAGDQVDSNDDYEPINEKTFDLSYVYNEETMHWPDSLGFSFGKKVISDHPYWYTANDFCVGEHAGTHLDAPYHFSRSGLKVGDIPMERLINKGFVLDVETFNDNKPSTVNTTLRPEHIRAFERIQFGKDGTIPPNSIVLIRFNWAQYYGTPRYYNAKKGGKKQLLHFPGISREAAQLLAERRIAGVGVDTASVDPGRSTSFDSHKIFAEANVYSMENVNIPDELSAYNDALVVYALPMNIMEGTGAPLRVVAVVPRKQQHPPAAAAAAARLRRNPKVMTGTSANLYGRE